MLFTVQNMYLALYAAPQFNLHFLTGSLSSCLLTAQIPMRPLCSAMEMWISRSLLQGMTATYINYLTFNVNIVLILTSYTVTL